MNIDKSEINIYFNKQSTDLDNSKFNLLWNGYSNIDNSLSIISYIESHDLNLKN